MVVVCVSNPVEREAGGVAAGSSLSLRGRGFAFPNDRGLAPAPPRHRARIVPVFVPTTPLARRRGVWVGVRVSQRLYNHHIRAEGLVREKSQLGG